MAIGKLRVTGTSKYQKTAKRANMPLLPGDMGILREMEKQKAENREKNNLNVPLDNTGRLKNFTPLDKPVDLRKNGIEAIDTCLVIRSLLSHMWSEYPRNSKNNGFALPPQLLSETAEARTQFPACATLSQIYGIFPTAGTLVDKAVSRDCRSGRIRLIPINSKEPASLDLVIESAEFYRLVDPVNPEFAALCRSKPDATWFDVADLRAANVDIPQTIAQGFLLVDPTKSVGSHTIAIPNQGRLLKLERLARTWLVKTITQCNRKFREMPESMIEDKLITPKRYWSQLRGVTLEWILYGCIGGGYIDGFQTPIGRGWKLLTT